MSNTTLAEFNPHYEETFDNSHELYSNMRATCPVAHSTAFGGFWAVFKYDDIVRIQEDPDTFITSILNVVPPATRNQGRRAPLHYDPPEHTMYRRHMNPVFSKSRMDDLEPAITRLADKLLAPLVARTTFDFTQDFAEYFGAQCFGMILKLPPEMMMRAREVQVKYYRSQINMDREAVVKWSNALYDVAREVVEERRANLLDPAEDLISSLLTAGERGGDISVDAVVGSIRQFLSASQAAPQAVLGSIAVHLAWDQDLQTWLRANPDRINDAVEEFLRLYAPYRVFARSANKDVTIAGREIKEGEPITLIFPSANRDEDVFERPHEFNIDRKPNKHIAFGRGPHQCPAASLARVELRIGTAALLKHTTAFEMAGDVIMTDWLEFGPSSTPLRVIAA
jgi:cytochrome P450